MAITCISSSISDPQDGKLRLLSLWSSNRSGGEFARFEIRLSVQGQFRFVVAGIQTTKVKAARRKVAINTQLDISAEIVNLIVDGERRLVRFEFCGITKSASGVETEVISISRKTLS